MKILEREILTSKDHKFYILTIIFKFKHLTYTPKIIIEVIQAILRVCLNLKNTQSIHPADKFAQNCFPGTTVPYQEAMPHWLTKNAVNLKQKG